MNSLLSVYSLVYLASALVPLVAIYFAWRHRDAPGARWLLILLLACTEWILTTAIAWAHVEQPMRILSSKLTYIGASTAPVFLLMFALEYTGRIRRISPTQMAQLLLLPLVSALAAATNDLHKLIWTSVTPAPENPAILVYSHGPLYWLVTVYGLVVTLVATVVLIIFAVRSRRLYRNQSIIVITAALIPWASHLIYSAMPGALVWFDPGMTVGLSAALLAFSVLRFRLLDLAPIARDVVIERMPGGLVVIDGQRRIVDMNAAAGFLLRISADDAIGKRLSEALASWPRVDSELDELEGTARFNIQTPWGSYLVVETWNLTAEGQGGGFAALISDVTAEVITERALLDARTRLDVWTDELAGLEAGLQGKAATNSGSK